MSEAKVDCPKCGGAGVVTYRVGGGENLQTGLEPCPCTFVCLERGEDCSGPVEYHTTGSSEKAWPRCTHHQEQREERYDNSIERYADSDVAPDWFDPSYAGESWDEI